jgi:hypothetical protein
MLSIQFDYFTWLGDTQAEESSAADEGIDLPSELA